MMREIIKTNSYMQQLRSYISGLASRKIDLDVQYIIIVPDHVTLTAEQELCRILGGAFDINVCSFNKLFLEYTAPDRKYLPKQGGTMLLKKILLEQKEKLTCYKKSVDKKNFAVTLYESISVLANECVSASEIESLPIKGADLALIMDEYEKQSAGYATSASRLSILRGEILDNDLFTNAHICLACFDKYTSQQEDIIKVLEKVALSVTEYVIDLNETSFNAIETYGCGNEVEIAKAVTSKIVNLLKGGAVCDEICVVTTDPEAPELKRIFDENAIPYIGVSSQKLSLNAFGRYLALALALDTRACNFAELVEFSKNIYTGLDLDEAYCLERYTGEYNIKFRPLTTPFVDYASERNKNGEVYKKAENARKKLCALLSKANSFESKITDLISCAEKVQSKRDITYSGMADPIKKAKELVELILAIMPNADYNLSVQSFIGGMEMQELAVIPALKGGIYIDKVSAYRAREFKYIFVLDFDYDNYPVVHNDAQLLTDDDIRIIKKTSECKILLANELNIYEERELLLLLNSADYIFLGYTQKLGAYFETISRIHGAVSIVENSYDRDMLESMTSASKLVEHHPTKSFLIEKQRTLACQSSESLSELTKSVAVLLRDELKKFEMPSGDEKCGEIELLDCFSASRIETYSFCPRQFFYRYILKAKPINTGELDVLKLGTLNHSIAEHYVSRGCKGNDDFDECIKLAITKHELDSNVEMDDYIKQLVSIDGHMILSLVSRHLDAGSYKPVSTESKFNYEGAFDVDGKRISLSGFVDRCDELDGYVRIVDYKSSKKDIDKALIYMGVTIQPLLYLGYFLSQGKKLGGAYYFPFKLEKNDDFPKVKGVTLDSEWSREVESMVNILGDNKRVAGLIMASEEEFEQYVSYVYRISEKLLSSLNSGFISPSPYDTSKCMYCDYKSVCDYKGDGRTKVKMDGGEKK